MSIANVENSVERNNDEELPSQPTTDDDTSDKKYEWKKRKEFSHLGVEVSSDLKGLSQRLKSFREKPLDVVKKHEVSKKPSITPLSISASASNALKIIDTIDKEARVSAEGTFAQSGTYVHKGSNKAGERIPKVGAYAEAGVGKASAEYSVFEAEARGPNASAGAEASAIGVNAMARAEIGSASATAGPINVRVGLGVDTGVSVGPDGLELKVLGTGFRFGPTTSLSLFGSEISCVIQ
ncbi:uncharacterized protein LOC134586165 [Pelobates fuscus]|uniref:uncharacterized protein LOC134586165 n=1 Tax=Pelobates fuscus TaxID=191477 RepID=UPI002FE45118